MSDGQGALAGGLSYLAVGRETTFGTGVTCTAGIDFLSANFKLTKENKIIEQIERSRTNSKYLTLSRKVEGELEFYYAPLQDSHNFILQNAFGGTITSATATGETVGGGAMAHTFKIGSMDQSYPSLSFNMRKGGSSGGKVFEYSGMRVGEIEFAAEIDEALKINSSFIGKDVTLTTNDVEGSLTVSSAPYLTFVNGRFSIENTFGSLTSSAFWHVQSVNISINNNLQSDASSRRLGSDTLVVLPPGLAQIEMKCKMRFDTTTAWTAMINATQLYGQVEFLGNTISGSIARQGIKFNFQNLRITDHGDPEVSDPSGIITSEITFAALRDDSSSTGYALEAVVTNNKASYA